MEKNKKVFLIGGISLALVAIITVAFAFFTTGDKQKLANTFSSGCLSITIDSETSAIDLKDAVPVTDVEGLKEDNGYSFTIKNNCSKESTYAIYLDKLDSTLEANYVKVSLSSDTMDNLITKLSDNSSEITNEGAVSSYNLFNGTIGAEETKEFTLKEWIDYDTTVEEGANKTFSSKINVAGDSRVTPISNVDIKFTKSLLTLIGTVPEGSSNIKYCTTTGNVCIPNKTIDITDNKITINLEEKETDQIVCTNINDGKIICSNPVNGKYCPSGSSACETILANRTFEKGEDSFTGIDDQEHKNDQGKSTLYTAEDDFGDSMYFRGNVDDNWLVFGKDTTNNQYIWWRIIRINGNGTIRLIYAGTNDSTTEAPATIGDDTMITPTTPASRYSKSVYFNKNANDNKYVGYMFGGTDGQPSTSYDTAHKSDAQSTVLKEIVYWYQNKTNLGELKNEIDVDTGFCGDRQVDKNASTYYSGDGYGKQNTGYAPFGRLFNNEWKSSQTPTLKCGYKTDGSGSTDKKAQVRDLYTGPNAKTSGIKGSNGEMVKGNNALPVPVGLITSDEVIYAGGFGRKANNGYWLYTNRDYWTMSPFHYENNDARVFYVQNDGNLIYLSVATSSFGVRPVINLKADTKLSGSGTTTDPYKIEYDNPRDQILADNKANGTPTFTGPSCSNCTVKENGIYTGEDDFGTSYVYRGTVDNNWVVFGQEKNSNKYIWWRIIRINGNGTIRLIYAGTSSDKKTAPSPQGVDTLITPKQTISSTYPRAVYFNQTANDNTYVGYMTGEAGQSKYEDTHTNAKNSTVLDEIVNWYDNNTNLGTLDDQFIDVDTGFCGDRQVDKTAHTDYQGDGYGNYSTGYAPWGRVYTNGSWKSPQTPTLKCGYNGTKTDTTAQERDLYTGPSANINGTKGNNGAIVKGNNKLPVPVGLITSDEVVFAGGFGAQTNNGYWLYTNQYYWTMSPFYMNSTGFDALFIVHPNGTLNSGSASNTSFGARPVINLKSNVKLTGSGTTTDPYIVS